MAKRKWRDIYTPSANECSTTAEKKKRGIGEEKQAKQNKNKLLEEEK